jgi:hypothetical protein
MNERIKYLAEQAGFMDSWFSESGDDCERELKKFAELIVEECIGCARGAGLRDDVALKNGLGFNDGISEVVVNIQKHFGIEE